MPRVRPATPEEIEEERRIAAEAAEREAKIDSVAERLKTSVKSEEESDPLRKRAEWLHTRELQRRRLID